MEKNVIFDIIKNVILPKEYTLTCYIYKHLIRNIVNNICEDLSENIYKIIKGYDKEIKEYFSLKNEKGEEEVMYSEIGNIIDDIIYDINEYLNNYDYYDVVEDLLNDEFVYTDTLGDFLSSCKEFFFMEIDKYEKKENLFETCLFILYNLIINDIYYDENTIIDEIRSGIENMYNI